MNKTLSSLAILAIVLVAVPALANDVVTTTATATPVLISEKPDQAKYEQEKKAFEARKLEVKQELAAKQAELKKQHDAIKANKASSTKTVRALNAEYNVKFEAARKARNAAIEAAQTEKRTALKALKASYAASSTAIYTNRTNEMNEAWKHYRESAANSTSTLAQLKKERNDSVNKSWGEAKEKRKQLNAGHEAQIKAINVKFNTAVKAAQDKFKTDTATLKAELEAKKKAILG
jgi:hypothetical protein